MAIFHSYVTMLNYQRVSSQELGITATNWLVVQCAHLEK